MYNARFEKKQDLLVVEVEFFIRRKEDNMWHIPLMQ